MLIWFYYLDIYVSNLIFLNMVFYYNYCTFHENENPTRITIKYYFSDLCFSRSCHMKFHSHAIIYAITEIWTFLVLTGKIKMSIKTWTVENEIPYIACSQGKNFIKG